MKLRAIIFALGAVCCISSAQEDSARDLFPLEVGQKWSYDFALSYHWTLAKYAQWDTGKVSCQITQKLESSDSTIWRFIQIRDYTHWSWANYTNYGPTHYSDTTTFDLVEMHFGNHQLYLFAPDWRAKFAIHSMFPFWKDYPSSFADSSRFYRFAPRDSSSTLILDLAVRAPYWSDRHLHFQEDIGVLESSGLMYSNNSETWRWSYWNCSFTNTYSGSHLNVQRRLSYAGFTNYRSDTTIALISNGTEPTTILGITTSNPLFVASIPTSIIPPLGSVPLTLRHQSPPEGSSSYRVVIVSDSPTSPDTIEVTINARTESVLHLSQSSFYYDKVWFSQRPFIANLVLSNAGNLPVTIDSLRASSPYVTWQVDRTSLQPGDSTTCRIAYVPNPTDFQTLGGPPYGGTASLHRDTLSIFSNASSSPDMIKFSAVVVGGTVAFNTHSLSFAANVQSTDRAVVTMTVGNPAMIISRGLPSNPSFKVTRNLNVQLIGYQSYTDTIFFAPQRGGESRGCVLYYSHSTLFGTDTIPAVDTVWLYGDAKPIRAFVDSVVDFGKIPPRIETQQTYLVSNTQNRPQTVERLPLLAGVPFACNSTLKTMLAPYSSIEDTVHFSSNGPGPHATSVYYIFTDDSGNTHIDSILLSATVMSTVCSLSVPDIDLGQISPGQRARTGLTLTSTVSAPLTVRRRFATAQSPFSFATPNDLSLGPFSVVQDTILFTATSVGTYSDVIDYTYLFESTQIGSDSVHLDATVSTVSYLISEHVLDYGSFPQGQKKTLSLTLTSTIGIEQEVARLPLPSDEGFSAVVPFTRILPPYGILVDTINAVSNRIGVHSTYAYYRFSLGYSFSTIDSVLLRCDVLPAVYSLGQNYPNPFNSATTITFDIPEATKGTVDVVDLLGREILVLIDGQFEPGRHMVKLTGDNLASGAYIYRLKTGSAMLSRKMLLVR